MISHRRSLASVAVLATLSLCCLSAGAQTSAPQPSRTGTIRGRVINESGRPLANVRVLARRLGSNEVEHTNTSTDGEGKFELSGLQPVNYRIAVFLQGYAPVD